VVVSSDQILHQNNTPISQFSGIIPFDGSGARVVNIVANDSMPMLLGNINQPARAIAPTIAAPMQAGQILNLGTANHGVGGQILNLPNGPTGGGQFYVMIPQSPVDVNHQKIAPRAHGAADTPLAAQRTEREEKRRQTHNEVERRRRDKINSWIHKLAKMVPNCKDELGTKHGGQMREQVTLKSKGGILQKTVNFIQELQIAHSQVVERLQEQNQVLGEMAKVRENLKRVEQENLLLRSQLQSHGFEPIDYASQSMQQSRQDQDTLKSCSEMTQPPMVTLSQTSTQQSVLYGQSSTMDDKDDEQ